MECVITIGQHDVKWMSSPLTNVVVSKSLRVASLAKSTATPETTHAQEKSGNHKSGNSNKSNKSTSNSFTTSTKPTQQQIPPQHKFVNNKSGDHVSRKRATEYAMMQDCSVLRLHLTEYAFGGDAWLRWWTKFYKRFVLPYQKSMQLQTNTHQKKLWKHSNSNTLTDVYLHTTMKIKRIGNWFHYFSKNFTAIAVKSTLKSHRLFL